MSFGFAPGETVTVSTLSTPRGSFTKRNRCSPTGSSREEIGVIPRYRSPGRLSPRESPGAPPVSPYCVPAPPGSPEAVPMRPPKRFSDIPFLVEDDFLPRQRRGSRRTGVFREDPVPGRNGDAGRLRLDPHPADLAGRTTPFRDFPLGPMESPAGRIMSHTCADRPGAGERRPEIVSRDLLPQQSPPAKPQSAPTPRRSGFRDVPFFRTVPPSRGSSPHPRYRRTASITVSSS